MTTFLIGFLVGGLVCVFIIGMWGLVGYNNRQVAPITPPYDAGLPPRERTLPMTYGTGPQCAAEGCHLSIDPDDPDTIRVDFRVNLDEGIVVPVQLLLHTRCAEQPVLT